MRLESSLEGLGMSFELNKNSNEVKLNEVAELITRGITPSYTEENGVIVINQKCIRDNRVNLELARLTNPEKRKITETKYLREFDVLINSTGVGTLGRVAQINQINQPMTVDSHVTIVRGNEKVDKKYLGYNLFMQQRNIEHLAEGSTGQTELSRIRLGEAIKVSLPSIPEQQAIANILSSLDEKIETNNEINKNLEEIAQAIFKQWFFDFEFPNENGEPYKSSGGAMVESELGMIPESWEVNYATEQFSVQSGGTPRTKTIEYWNGEIPFFTPKDCSSDLFVLETEKNITELGLSKCNSKLYSKGTVFITARGTVGNVAIAGKDMAMNQSCYALVSNDGYTNAYIYYLTKQLVNKLKRNASGSVFDAVTVSTFSNLKTIIPNQDIVKKFDLIVKKLHLSILNNTIENEKIRSIRDTLLPKLMSGEIRVPVEE